MIHKQRTPKREMSVGAVWDGETCPDCGTARIEDSSLGTELATGLITTENLRDTYQCFSCGNVFVVERKTGILVELLGVSRLLVFCGRSFLW